MAPRRSTPSSFLWTAAALGWFVGQALAVGPDRAPILPKTEAEPASFCLEWGLLEPADHAALERLRDALNERGVAPPPLLLARLAKRLSPWRSTPPPPDEDPQSTSSRRGSGP